LEVLFLLGKDGKTVIRLVIWSTDRRLPSMFTAYLRVVSDVLSQDDLTAKLGPSSEATSRSASRAATWRKDLFRGVVPWPEGVEVYLGPDLDALASRIRQLVADGTANAWLVVVQDVDDPDDTVQKGIWLDPTMIAWMAKAKMGLNIDSVHHFLESLDCHGRDAGARRSPARRALATTVDQHHVNAGGTGWASTSPTSSTQSNRRRRYEEYDTSASDRGWGNAIC
jgi:hypothetical protein